MKITEKGFIYEELKVAPSCHASTIVKLSDGTLLASWFAGAKEGADDVMIWTSYYKDNKWSTPLMVSPEEGIPHWNPVLMNVDDTTTCLFYKIGKKIAEWKTMYTLTKDGGKTWSTPAELVLGDTSGGRGPVKNKAIVASDGSILAPASTEIGPWRPFIDIYTKETGWFKSEIPVNVPDSDKVNLIQPTLWESTKGHIHALLRSNQGKIYRSDSTDFGRTWSNVYPTDMPNNNSGIDLTKLADGSIVLVCNPVGEDHGKRSPLSVYVSTDNGETFLKEFDIETEDAQFSYPAIINDGDRIYITYTWKRKKIGYCVVE